MEVKLSPKESEEIFLNALCNGGGEIASYGISLNYSKEARVKALKSLKSPCMEDVWMQILKDGGELVFSNEDDDDVNTVTLKEVHKRVSETPHKHLMDMIDENDDAITADCVLQTVIFGEVIYG